MKFRIFKTELNLSQTPNTCFALIRYQKIRRLYKTSVDNDTKSPDSSVLSLSGRTNRPWTAFFCKFRPESRHWTVSRKKYRYRTVFLKNLDGIRIADRIETDRIRTDRNRTGFSGNSDKTRQGQDTDRTVRRRLSCTVQLVSVLSRTQKISISKNISPRYVYIFSLLDKKYLKHIWQ